MPTRLKRCTLKCFCDKSKQPNPNVQDQEESELNEIHGASHFVSLWLCAEVQQQMH